MDIDISLGLQSNKESNDFLRCLWANIRKEFGKIAWNLLPLKVENKIFVGYCDIGLDKALEVTLKAKIKGCLSSIIFSIPDEMSNKEQIESRLKGCITKTRHGLGQYKIWGLSCSLNKSANFGKVEGVSFSILGNKLSIKVKAYDEIRIEVVESDKMLGSNYISKEEADSLISVMKRQERMLEDKYQYALDQKMNEDRYFSIGTFVVGVVISVFGFFGFKSLKSIEEKAKENSQRLATKISEDVTKEYLKQRLQGLVTIESEKILKSSAAESLKKEILDSVYKKYDEKFNSLSEEDVSESQQIENISDSDDNDLF